MLSIILMILKILGILLAVILGLIILICLIVLFVPVRYEIKVVKKDDLVVHAKVHWLLRAIYMRLWLLDHKLHIRLRIIGYIFYDNLRPKKEKKKKRKKKKPNKKVKTDFLNETNDLLPDEIQTDKKDEETRTESLSDSVKPGVESEEKDKSEGKESHKNFFSKLKDGFKKVIGFFTGLRDKIKNIWNLVKALLEKKNMVMLFLRDENTKAGIKTLILRIIDILKYCGPQRLEGFVHFGTGDPAGTGQMLSIAAIFYGMYGENIRIEPDFNNKVLEVDIYAKGRIRIIRLIIICIKLWRAHEFKQLLKDAKKLKEEL